MDVSKSDLIAPYKASQSKNERILNFFLVSQLPLLPYKIWQSTKSSDKVQFSRRLTR